MLIAKSTYNLLQEGSMQFSAAEGIWENGASLKCKIFAFLAMQYRLHTSDRRGVNGVFHLRVSVG